MEIRVTDNIKIIRLEAPIRWQIAVTPSKGPVMHWPDTYTLHPGSPFKKKEDLDRFFDRVGVDQVERNKVYQKIAELEAQQENGDRPLRKTNSK
jgi:hypothetical protein